MESRFDVIERTAKDLSEVVNKHTVLLDKGEKNVAELHRSLVSVIEFDRKNVATSLKDAEAIRKTDKASLEGDYRERIRECERNLSRLTAPLHDQAVIGSLRELPTVLQEFRRTVDELGRRVAAIERIATRF